MYITGQNILTRTQTFVFPTRLARTLSRFIPHVEDEDHASTAFLRLAYIETHAGDVLPGTRRGSIAAVLHVEIGSVCIAMHRHLVAVAVHGAPWGVWTIVDQ